MIFIALSGCAQPGASTKATVYDFGPGRQSASAGQRADNPTARAPLIVDDIEASPALDSTHIQYRLLYANEQELRAYSQARWSMTPAQLLRQRLRDTLGQRRTVLSPADGHPGGGQPGQMLRIELEEFSQLFSAPAQSTGLVRLRATLLQSSPAGDRLLGQRTVVAQRAATSADAPGGVRALTEATEAAVQELEQWLGQWR